MKKRYLWIAVALITGIVVTLALSNIALAHEDRIIGPYKLHVGWHVEPALVGYLNSVELSVTQNSVAVPDIEKTLTVTVSTGGKTSEKFHFTPSDETPGMYTAALIPTVAGDYTFHFIGAIGSTPVDVTFDTADGKIDPVEPTTDLQFPEKEPSNAALQKEIDELKAQIAALKGSAGLTPAATAAQ